MQLRDWEVTVAHDPLIGVDVLLAVELHPERRLLRLRRTTLFYEVGEAERRHALTHELAHTMLRDLYETVRRTAEQEIGGAAYRVFVGQVRLEMERLADTMAVVIAPSMPVLAWE